MRTLEKNLGVRLLHRTTRSVSATEAGDRLVARLGPVIRDLDRALEELSAFRSRPRGTLRINSSEVPARQLLHAVVPTFLARHPEMSLDLVTDGKLVDIVAEGFDAGIRLGEQVPQDMVGGAQVVPTGAVLVIGALAARQCCPPHGHRVRMAHDRL